MNINPYKLLGVSINSSISELKKNYYNLALICHPDRGGNNEDMIILKNSYDYIKPQLSNKSHKTYEQLEDDFSNFCKDQEDKICPFSFIYEESHDWIKDFNKEFDHKKKIDNSKKLFDRGYGHLMEDSIIDTDYIDNEKNTVTNDFKDKLVIYKEPHSTPFDIGNFERFDLDHIEDFSQINPKLNIKDYKKAFSNPVSMDNLIDNEKISNDIEKSFNKLCKERKLNENDYKHI